MMELTFQLGYPATEEQVARRILGVNLAERVDRKAATGPRKLHPVNLKLRMAGDRELDQLSPMRPRRNSIGRFVRRLPGRQKPDPIQSALLPATLGQEQMPDMDRIERSAD